MPDAGLGASSSTPTSTPTRRWRKLEEQLLHVLRLDEDDPVAAWRERADTLVAAAERLTERGFDALHYEGPGTDLTVGLLPAAAGWPRASRPPTASSTCRTSRPRRSSRRPTPRASTAT